MTKLTAALLNFPKRPRNGLQTVNDGATSNKKWTLDNFYFCPSPLFRRHRTIPLRSPGERLSVVTIFISRTVLVPTSSRRQSMLQNIRDFLFTIKLDVERNQAICDEQQSCTIKCTFCLSFGAERASSRSFNFSEWRQVQFGDIKRVFGNYFFRYYILYTNIQSSNSRDARGANVFIIFVQE